jgi:hypothetical protein
MAGMLYVMDGYTPQIDIVNVSTGSSRPGPWPPTFRQLTQAVVSLDGSE